MNRPLINKISLVFIETYGKRSRGPRLLVPTLFIVWLTWLTLQVGARWDFLLAELESPLPLNGKTMVAAQLDDLARHSPGEEVGYAGYGADIHGVSIN